MRLQLKDLGNGQVSVTHKPCCNEAPREMGKVPDYMLTYFLSESQFQQYKAGASEFVVRGHVVSKIQFTA